MKIAIETDVYENVYADADSSNKGATAGAKSGSYDMGYTAHPVKLDEDSILEFIVDCGSVLDEQNVPGSGRWIILPPMYVGMLKKSDIKDASAMGDSVSVIRNGLVGRIDRFDVYTSNLLYSLTDTTLCWHVLAGHPSALTFAAQMTNMESLRAESTFGSLVRGLNVYGYKVVKPEALVDAYVTKASS
jgi:hypothetical protein